MTKRMIAPLLMLMLGCVGSAACAQSLSCPAGLNSNDACDQWQFEQADKELASIVELALAEVDRFAHSDTRQEAKERLNQAQQLWSQTRQLDCQAESALMWLRSARTRRGYTASCMHDLTVRRISELKKRYRLSN
jgi:uncharacterized protein YecT (DUF1311 family)